MTVSIGPGWSIGNGWEIGGTAPTSANLLLSLDAGNPASYPGSGTTWTDTVSSIAFTLNNGPTYSASNGGYINFTAASNQYADSSVGVGALTNWTVEAWHYYDGTNAGASPCIVTENYTGGSYVNYALGSTSDDSPYLSAGYFNNAWYTTPTNTYQLTSGNWYQIVGTYDGTNAKLYVNNTLVQTGSGGPTPGTTGIGIHLMARWDAPGISDYWGGRLSIVKIWDGDIGASGVTTEWNANKARFGL